MKKLLLVGLIGIAASTAYAANVAGNTSNTKYVKALPSTTIPGNPMFHAGKAGIAMPTKLNETVDISKVVSFAEGPVFQANRILNNAANGTSYVQLKEGSPKISQFWKNTQANGIAIYAFRQITEPLPNFPQFGGEVIAKVPGAEVYFGEWAPITKLNVQDSTDLNMNHANRTAYYVGENPTAKMPNLVNVKYNVTGIKKYNPGTQAGVTTGVLTANFANNKGSIAGKLGNIDFAGTNIKADGIFVRGKDIEGRFYGNNAEALAGIHKAGADSTAFGGKRQ